MQIRASWGNAPFEGFDRHFVGINGFMLVPLTIDGLTYYSNNSQLANKYMTTKDVKDRANNEFYAEYGDDIKELNLDIHEHGVLDSKIKISYRGNISAYGYYNFFSRQTGMLPHYVERNSSINVGYLFTLFSLNGR